MAPSKEADNCLSRVGRASQERLGKACDEALSSLWGRLDTLLRVSRGAQRAELMCKPFLLR